MTSETSPRPQGGPDAAASPPRGADGPADGPAAGISSDLSESISEFFRLAAKARFRMRTEHELEWSAFSVLAPLAECGPLRSSALADATHLDPSRVSRLTNHLIELGQVARTPDAADGRASLLTITPPGREALTRLKRKREDFLSEIVADWSAADQAHLADLLGRLAADMADLITKKHKCGAEGAAHASSHQEHA